MYKSEITSYEGSKTRDYIGRGVVAVGLLATLCPNTVLATDGSGEVGFVPPPADRKLPPPPPRSISSSESMACCCCCPITPVTRTEANALVMPAKAGIQ